MEKERSYLSEPLNDREISVLRRKYPTRDLLVEALVMHLLDQGVPLLQAGLLVSLTSSHVVDRIHPRAKVN